MEYRRPLTKPEKGPEVWIERLVANQRLEVLILSPWPQPFTIHWDKNAGKKGRSRPCTVPESKCYGCRIGLPSKWLAYLFCQKIYTPKPEFLFLEVTPGADEWLRMHTLPGEDLRGKSFRVLRGNGNSSRLRFEPITLAVNVATLPPDKDATESLEKVWFNPERYGEDEGDNGITLPFNDVG